MALKLIRGEDLPDPGLSDIDLAVLEGFSGAIGLVRDHIKQLREEWDHIESAVQVLDSLWDRIAEDTK